MLKNIGVWPYCQGEAASLDAIRIIDDTGRLLRAPEVEFRAAELGLEAFGFNVPNQALVAALRRRASELADLSLIETAGAESVGVLAIALYIRNRNVYLLMRNAFLLSGGIGLIFYYAFPVAPPGLMPDAGFVDTVLE